MKLLKPTNLRSRLTFWYVAVLALLLFVYAAIVFAFQYAAMTRQMLHDEIQDVVTVEGLLYFDAVGQLQLRQDYFSRPQSHLLVDRYMEVRDISGKVLYRSPTLRGMPLDGPIRNGEGDRSFNERVVRLENGNHAFIISHIHGMDGRILLIRLGYSLVPLRDRMLQFLLLLVIAIPLALILAAMAGQGIARRALRPIHTLTEHATHISASNLHDRLEVPNSDDELGHMALAFNHLLGRLDGAFQQLRRFTADAAHELRAPLASIRTVGEVALGQGTEAGSRKAIEDILEETSRLNETVDSLLLLSRVEAAEAPGQFEIFPLRPLVEEVAGLLGVMMEDAEVKVTYAFETDKPIQADRNLLRLALVNVMHNAWKFAPHRSTIQVRSVMAGDMVQLSIQDEGPGIPPNEQEQVFNRFYTGSNPPGGRQKGTGLGLSIAKLVVERCSGNIAFDSGMTSGARCIIQLRSIAHNPNG
ncbi:HAMP domain-containing protein [Terriglobus albidus]|uniref:histidine kinase n=1 Tax=Terriglobus albidus TaxID=1592106 RepID=A0A5B9EA70_9BACT|nr:ATP-binding protein [Terriglobus albidus]QEE28564.1 HAMP domain-containing protein [Terriglobus albidus]